MIAGKGSFHRNTGKICRCRMLLPQALKVNNPILLSCRYARKSPTGFHNLTPMRYSEGGDGARPINRLYTNNGKFTPLAASKQSAAVNRALHSINFSCPSLSSSLNSTFATPRHPTWPKNDHGNSWAPGVLSVMWEVDPPMFTGYLRITLFVKFMRFFPSSS